MLQMVAHCDASAALAASIAIAQTHNDKVNDEIQKLVESEFARQAFYDREAFVATGTYGNQSAKGHFAHGIGSKGARGNEIYGFEGNEYTFGDSWFPSVDQAQYDTRREQFIQENKAFYDELTRRIDPNYYHTEYTDESEDTSKSSEFTHTASVKLSYPNLVTD